MRISVTIFVILISTYLVNASVLDPVIENVVHLKASKPPPGVSGIWKKKTIWKPRWVKEWKSAKVVKPVWKKVWSPVQIREWVPIPKPPPGWDTISTPLAPIITKPQKAQDSVGHDSFNVQSSANVPLWDPIPYPESQQPPPPPPPVQALHHLGACGASGCDNSPAPTFNQDQISEIIGSKHNEYSQNPENSETVNQYTRLPPAGNNWKPFPPIPDHQFDNRFNNFPGLPDFLIPPKFKLLPGNTLRLQPNNKPNNFNAPIPSGQVNHSQGLQNSVKPWIPLPPENNIKGHFITKAPDQPYKFQLPLPEQTNKPNLPNLNEKQKFQNQSSVHPQANGDFIQEAQLVGEYHYSEFDLHKQVPQQPLPLENERINTNLQHNINAGAPNFQKPTANQQPVAPVTVQQSVSYQQPVAPITVQQSKSFQQPVVVNTPQQNPTEPKLDAHHKQAIQKKHINDATFNTSNAHFNFQQQKGVLREIFPIYRAPQNVKQPAAPEDGRFANTNEIPPQINYPSTKLYAVDSKPSFNSSALHIKLLQEVEHQPVYEISQNIPTNHKTLPPTASQETSFQRNQMTTKLVSSDESHKPETPERNIKNSVHLVFPTAPEDSPDKENKLHIYKYSTGDLQKTTTTEAYSVIFPSSLSTTESVTKSPVFIVTPINTKKI